jgi:hypothetical protein
MSKRKKTKKMNEVRKMIHDVGKKVLNMDGKFSKATENLKRKPDMFP